MRQYVLALALLTGCGRLEPETVTTAPETKSPLKPVPAPPPGKPREVAPPKPRQEEEPIIRRSQHRDELETERVELQFSEPVTRDFIAFVDVPANCVRRAKAQFDAKAPVEVVTVPGSGEAQLYLFWKGLQFEGSRLSIRIDRRDRIVTVALEDRHFEWPKAARERGTLYGYRARLGPLEAGGWVVEVVNDQQVSGAFTFVAGPGGPESKPQPVDRKVENDLPAFHMWPGATMEHDLIAFACREEDFEAIRALALGVAKPHEPTPLPPKAGDDLNLYVLWGRRIASPDASAQFDRKSSAVRVSVRWAGGGGMKMVRTSRYAGYGFKLGLLEAGTYSVEVAELFPTAPESRRVTKKLSFEVRARP